jgi:hypothetical protein
VFVAFCVCSGLAAPSIDNYIAPQTVNIPSAEAGNVTKYVKHAHRASLNFACQIDRITVTANSDKFAAGFEDPITQIELEDHLGEPSNIEWAHVMQQFFESTDSRGQERQLGTIGGDLGQFLIVLQAYENQLNVQFKPEEVLQKFRLYLTIMSREKFYFDIDAPAIESLKSACGCPNLNIADPPDSKKDLLRTSTHTSQSNGNELFKKVLASPADYEFRTELVYSVLDAFYTVMWKKSDPLHRRIKFVLLKGESAPKGLIFIKTPGYCNAQLLAPMISPELCSKQMGIYHGDASVLLQTEIAGIVMSVESDVKNSVVSRAIKIATKAFTEMLKDHLEPVYTVAFEGF